jgi:hypothetical protein
LIPLHPPVILCIMPRSWHSLSARIMSPQPARARSAMSEAVRSRGGEREGVPREGEGGRGRTLLFGRGEWLAKEGRVSKARGEGRGGKEEQRTGCMTVPVSLPAAPQAHLTPTKHGSCCCGEVCSQGERPWRGSAGRRRGR